LTDAGHDWRADLLSFRQLVPGLRKNGPAAKLWLILASVLQRGYVVFGEDSLRRGICFAVADGAGRHGN
jgi:hypothetical protein